MRHITHTDPAANLPRPMLVDAWTLPHQRRERVDANIRRAIGDLRALALEDTVFPETYAAMARCFEAALELLNAVEDFDTSHSVKA